MGQPSGGSRIVTRCSRCDGPVGEEDIWVTAVRVLVHCDACGLWAEGEGDPSWSAAPLVVTELIAGPPLVLASGWAPFDPSGESRSN